MLASCQNTASVEETAVSHPSISSKPTETTWVETAVFPTHTPKPTATSTPQPTETPIPTLRPTKTPTPGPLAYVTPVSIQIDEFQFKLFPNEPQTDIVLQLLQSEKLIQEVNLTELNFEETDLFLPILLVDFAQPIITDYAQDGIPEIILTFFTPGASCCGIVTILYFDIENGELRNSNALVNKYTLTATVTDIEEDEQLELLRRNEEFHYALNGATVISAVSPLQIFSFANGELIDVSSQHPVLIAEDANYWLAEALERDCQHWPWGAYLAEMHLLNREIEGWQNFSDACSDAPNYENSSELLRKTLEAFGYSKSNDN